MDRIYSVTINGRVLEGRDIRDLLARAVSAKRNVRLGRMQRAGLYNNISTEHSPASYSSPEIAAVH